MQKSLLPVLTEVARMQHCHPSYVFKCFFDYDEQFHGMSRELIMKLWKATEKGTYYDECICDFCLDVINGAIKFPPTPLIRTEKGVPKK